MYISIDQSQKLDTIIKSYEVAFRSFIADTMDTSYPSHKVFDKQLRSISISNDLIYSRKFSAKLRKFVSSSAEIYSLIEKCKKSLASTSFDNNVPYVSELIDLMLIFFTLHFSDKDIVKAFSSIEEFHYCCTVYHKIRNNLSHPASHPTTIIDANKVVYFIENGIGALSDKYFWYSSKTNISEKIRDYNNCNNDGFPQHHNLGLAPSTHKSLLCREKVINDLYEALLGSEVRQRLAGSVVIYGYGGVGKTAITTEFLYRLIRDRKDEKHKKIDYLLFFSSKDEYLRSNNTSGELYIDSAKPEFSTLEELQQLICASLKIETPQDITGRGIIAIDNIENIHSIEKDKIINFIKSLPRNVQFIVTSRNEEQCEEKMHIEEFKNDDTGVNFVEQMVESEGFDINLKQGMAGQILDASKGNALIIIQILNILDRQVSTLSSIITSLESMRSKNSEMIANFMYKNTFDAALKYLSSNGHPINDLLQVISLYDERIELYSISKLLGIGIADAERTCNYLLERLILKKTGEYYELNEFAKRFVFIKLLPDRFQMSRLKEKIRTHKERMKLKLAQLDSTLTSNSILHRIVNEWQPRNYIDTIVIAELFSIYGQATTCVKQNNQRKYEQYLKEFDEHSFITSHPYVPLQKARLYRQGMYKFYRNDTTILAQVERLYEEAVESIEYDYRYLIGSLAHASLLMMFGIFLCQHLKEYSRAIRILEEAKYFHGNLRNKGWFIICNYLSVSHKNIYKETKEIFYKEQLASLVSEVLEAAKTQLPKQGFDLKKYKEDFC
jgi:hypothetical protein